ncbi:MAG TPA: SRPBCC domain-containing protein [Bacteroidia bacterium]|nr:SRPBCC domain-containing protein [Bacteroidia bacterium]
MEKNPFKISRLYNAPPDLVWKAHTELEHLKQWCGPGGFTSKTARLDFRVGGSYHYCVIAPGGIELWGMFVYREITPKTKLVMVVSFSDEAGGMTRNPFSPEWPLEVLNTMTFTEEGTKTRLTLEGYPINATDKERATYTLAYESMGQGYKGTLDNLEEHLARIQN